MIFASLLFSTNVVFAASYNINMPTGSASPDAPYFWQNEKSGLATGDIEILVGDTVVWKNGDRAKHTVTSGTVDGGPDGLFGGTNFMVPGQSYSFKFDEKGNYPYYCLIHPWMIGTVYVVDGFQIIPQVGKTIGDGSVVFDVKYQFDRVLSLVTIDEKQKLITFEIIGKSQTSDNTLKIYLPPNLIDGPFVVIVDGTKITEYVYLKDDMPTLTISIPENSKLLTIIGTSIVPEFGVFSIVVLTVCTMSVVLFSRKSKLC